MWSHLLTLACALLLLPAQALAGRQGEGRGACSVGAGARDGRRGQRAGGPERRPALCPCLRRQDRDRLAGDGGPGRRLPLPDALLPRRRAETLRARGRRSLSDFRRAGSARVEAGRRDRQGAAHRHRARRELLPLRHPHPGHRGHRRGLRRAELSARRELQHHPCGAQGKDGPLRREADPDHAAGDQPVPGAGPRGSRPHQPDPGPRGGPALCRRADRRIHRAGRRQRQGQDLDRNRARRPRAGLRSPPVAQPCGDPHRLAPRLEQLHRQPGLPGDRRASPGRAGQPREVAPGRERDAREARPCRFHPSRGGVRHQPRQPLHGPRPRPVAAPLQAPCRPAPRRRRRPASRPAAFPASAPWRAMPTPPGMGACAS